MVNEKQIMPIAWNNANRRHFENKGYSYTKQGDIFYPRIKDFSHGADYPIAIVCDECGQPYSQSYCFYRKRRDQKHEIKDVCQQCKQMIQSGKYYANCLKQCNLHGYTLLSTPNDMKRNSSNIEYICPRHGVQTIKEHNMEYGKGCRKCANEANAQKYKKETKEVSKHIEKCGGILMNPLEYVNQAKKNLLISCPLCKHPFVTSYRVFTQHGGQLCNGCSDGKRSIGEKYIKQYLDEHKLEYIEQYWFPDCRDVNPLPFDFYLPSENLIIEFDGRQHFGETGYFSYSYEETHRHDEIKNNYCKSHNITLIRIPYWHINKIYSILNQQFS